ncbi:hypothetical protein [Arthrobacter sp. MA-N2]|uniref:hypothetical protein n=1 Tax=Arthrobacter sp. MA-N2 TaxID=1101188 RepID=UPI000486118D|nr:hypothetical protein [Arthrobacter sp. MA-N2]
MSKFKIGDHVRVIATPCRWFDQTGTVHDEAPGAFHIADLESHPLWFHPDELILADPLNVMLNDVEGQQLVRNIHDRKEKTL